VLTRLAVWAAVVTTIATIIWPATATIQTVAAMTMFAAAVVAALKAGEHGSARWTWSFVAIAVLFNPVAGLHLPGMSALVIAVASLAILVSWLIVLDRTASTRGSRELAGHVPGQ
jgi:NO-binding membrane sensor protein with MHYT domain